MKSITRNIIYLLIVMLTTFACDDSELIDTTAPAIEVEEPHDQADLVAGEFAVFKAKFVDDFELATYNIEIHDNFGGHTHGRIASVGEDPSLLKWSYKQSFLIPDGLTLFQAVLEDEIEIPDNALAGPYHFIVQAIDKAGNATSFQDDSSVEFEVYLSNDSQPIVNISNLVEGELEIEADILFMVKGNITDPTTGEYAGIHSMSTILGEGHHDDHDHNHGGRIAEEDLIDEFFEEEALREFMVDGDIIIDKVFEYIDFRLSQEQLDDLAAEEVDHLLLTITVYDEQGNIAVCNTDVHLHFE